MTLRPKYPRIAVRALILHDARLLVVNAYPGNRSDLWCAPGGGVHPGTSLPDNLIREVHEETGLRITPTFPAMINEFHDPATGFHQVEVFFRCSLSDATLDPLWHDPEGIVTTRRFVTRSQLLGLRHKPDSLADIAWNSGFTYDALEVIVP